jgi:hypothetical protein
MPNGEGRNISDACYRGRTPACPLCANDKDAPFRYYVQQVATGRQFLAAGQEHTTYQGMSCFVSHGH